MADESVKKNGTELEQLTELKKIEGAIDAILFAAGHPVEYSKIAETLAMTQRDARRIAELHDRTLAEVLFDLAQRDFQRFFFFQHIVFLTFDLAR